MPQNTEYSRKLKAKSRKQNTKSRKQEAESRKLESGRLNAGTHKNAKRPALKFALGVLLKP
jgi:hypothetical protein